MREEKQTLIEMLIGLLIAIALVEVIGVVIVSNKLTYLLSVLFGGVVAAIVLFQMYYTLGKAVEMEEKNAARYTVLSSLVRLVIMGAALAVGVIWPNIFHVVGILLGLLCLKLCAFIEPIIHRVLFSRNELMSKGR